MFLPLIGAAIVGVAIGVVVDRLFRSNSMYSKDNELEYRLI